MKLIFSESPSKTVLYLRSLIDLHIKPRRTVRLSGKLIAVNRPPARCEDVIFVTSTFHMSMESSFETQFKVVLLKTDPEHHFPDPHSFQLSNRTDNLNSITLSIYNSPPFGKNPDVAARARPGRAPGPRPRRRGSRRAPRDEPRTRRRAVFALTISNSQKITFERSMGSDPTRRLDGVRGGREAFYLFLFDLFFS